jgi:exosome complex RNA-binding protein Csl4
MPEDDIHPVLQKDVLAMIDDQQHMQAIHEQRITQVEKQVIQHETRMTIIEVSQGRLEASLVKVADAVADQVTKTTLHEAAIVVLKDGIEKHSKHIEDMKDEQVDMGKLFTKLESQMSILRLIGMALISVIIGYFFSHFIH